MGWIDGGGGGGGTDGRTDGRTDRFTYFLVSFSLRSAAVNDHKGQRQSQTLKNQEIRHFRFCSRSVNGESRET